MRRLLPFVAFIVLLIGAIAAVPFLLQPEAQRARLTESLSKTFRRPAMIGDVHFAYFPPSIEINRVVLTTPEGNPFIQVERVSAPLSLGALLTLHAVPQELQITGLSLTAYRKPDGRWDFADWWPAAEGSESSPMGLRRVEFKSSEFHAVDNYASTSQQVAINSLEGLWVPSLEKLDVHGTFAAPLAGISLTWNAKGQFFGKSEWTGDLQLNDRANTLRGTVISRAGTRELKAQAGKWRLAAAATLGQFVARVPMRSPDSSSLFMDNWQLSGKEEGGKISFEHTAAISGGQSELKGTITPDMAGAIVRLQGAVSAVPLEGLLTLVGEDIPLAGKATGITREFEMTLSSQTASTVKGEGVLNVEEGHYLAPETSLKKIAKAKTMTYLNKKYPDLATSGIPFTKLTIDWKAMKGHVTLSAALLATSARSTWTGDLDLLRSGMDGFVRIDFREKDSKLRHLIPTKYHTQPAFGRVQGTWQEWALKSIPSSKVPAAAQAKIRKAAAAVR